MIQEVPFGCVRVVCACGKEYVRSEWGAHRKWCSQDCPKRPRQKRSEGNRKEKMALESVALIERINVALARDDKKKVFR